MKKMIFWVNSIVALMIIMIITLHAGYYRHFRVKGMKKYGFTFDIRHIFLDYNLQSFFLSTSI